MVGRGATLIKPRLLVTRKWTLKPSWRLSIAANVHCICCGDVLFSDLVRCCLWGFRSSFFLFFVPLSLIPVLEACFHCSTPVRNSLSEHGLFFNQRSSVPPTSISYVLFATHELIACTLDRRVGDPFKDTAGPSLHVLIKMLATITLVMAPLFLDN
jgi:hypothetical protein